MRLQNKIAIITGAGSGIGRGITLAFIKEGAKVVVADWSEEGGKETLEQIRKINGEAVFVNKASMAELADAHDSKSCGSDSMRVRFSLEAPVRKSQI